MFRRTKFLIAAGLIAFTGVSACGNADFGMVAVSDAVVSADIGGFALSKECGLKFKNGRMCTSKEVIEAVNPPTSIPSGVAFVQPIHGAVYRDTLDRLVVLEMYTGVQGFFNPFTTNLNCGSWSSTSTDLNALVLVFPAGKGVFGTLNCANPARVACCAPK